jgi:hypothetical protein
MQQERRGQQSPPVLIQPDSSTRGLLSVWAILLSSSLIQLVNVSKYNQKPLPVTEEVFDFQDCYSMKP